MRYNDERKARAQQMVKWLLGHAVEVDCNMDPHNVRILVGDQVFEDPRRLYPSTKLVADIALCLDASGYSRDAFAIGDLDDEVITDLMDHAVAFVTPRYSIWASPERDIQIGKPRALMFDGVRMP